MGALPVAALPPVYPMKVNDAPRRALVTLVSIGREHYYVGRENHFGNRDGLNARLKKLLAEVGAYFRKDVTITSGCRSHDANRRAGGAPQSLHLFCLAADIKVAGVSKLALVRYVQALRGIGGIGTYCSNGIVHIDLGPRRRWFHHCRK
jgi:uncharacterized protein YcbK (DUF882 family)